jgi:translation initiation factor IF-3
LSQGKIRINKEIKSSPLRVIGQDGANLGVIELSEALRLAEEAGLDLLEVAPNANPPVAKIMDFGKYQYEVNKKQKASRSRSQVSEIKSVQLKVGTSEHDLELKARKISEWLKEGHRIRIDLFLPGRTKYMDKDFLESRLKRILVFITEEYKIGDSIQKSPKGLSMIIERK